MELSLHRLRMLHEFARRGTVTGAAEVLHYTPSAVSQQLAVLEREVGVELLEQVGRRVRLTEIGRVLARHAAEILEAEERARLALEQAQRVLDADLTVGMPATLAGSLVPPTLALLGERHPGVRVKTREVVPEETPAAVRDGDLDLAFVLDYPEEAPASWGSGLEAALAGREQLYLVAPRGTLDGAGPVRLADLADRPWVASETDTEFGRALRAMCARAGFTPRIAHQVDAQATAMAMVAAGLGVTLVADLGLTFRPDRVQVTAFRPPIRRRVLILRRAATRDRPAERAFLRAALDTAQELGLEQAGEAAPAPDR